MVVVRWAVCLVLQWGMGQWGRWVVVVVQCAAQWDPMVRSQVYGLAQAVEVVAQCGILVHQWPVAVQWVCSEQTDT